MGDKRSFGYSGVAPLVVPDVASLDLYQTLTINESKRADLLRFLNKKKLPKIQTLPRKFTTETFE
jgi:hypothetical protein